MTLLRPAPRRNARRAFTLMEVLVVVAIIVVLASIGFVAFRYLGESKEQICKTRIKVVEDAVSAYYLKNGGFPASLEELITPPDSNTPAYLEPSAILDPWGKPFEYLPGQRSTTGKPKIQTISETGKIISNW